MLWIDILASLARGRRGACLRLRWDEVWALLVATLLAADPLGGAVLIVVAIGISAFDLVASCVFATWGRRALWPETNQTNHVVQRRRNLPPLAPVHVGGPAQIGIRDLARPDFGDSVAIRPGEVPVYWACVVTPQAVAMQAKPPLMITHAPGHMFITDLKNEELAIG